MKGITIKHRGSFSNTLRFLNKILDKDYLNMLDQYGREGVSALSSATPKDSGLASNSWNYVIEHNSQKTTIYWTNSDEESSAGARHSVNIALILQYGYVNGKGVYIAGRDYINPAIRPIFDRMANEIWTEVTKT